MTATKYISEYTEETAPAITDKILIDQDEGDYRYVEVQKLFAGTGTKSFNGTYQGTVDANTVLTAYAGKAIAIEGVSFDGNNILTTGTLGCGSITSTGAISGTSGTFSSGSGATSLILDRAGANGATIQLLRATASSAFILTPALNAISFLTAAASEIARFNATGLAMNSLDIDTGASGERTKLYGARGRIDVFNTVDAATDRIYFFAADQSDSSEIFSIWRDASADDVIIQTGTGKNQNLVFKYNASEVARMNASGLAMNSLPIIGASTLGMSGDLTNSAGDIILQKSGALIKRDDRDNTLILSGGNASNVGANILLYGDTHGSSPKDILFRAGGTTMLTLDGATSDAIFAGDVYTTAWTNYASTSTITGWSGTPTQYIYYKKIGNLVYVNFLISGTSDATTVSFTLPHAAVNNSVDFRFACEGADNGTDLTAAVKGVVAANTSQVDIYTNWANAAWTNSGTKRVDGMFWYEAQ